MTDTTTNDAEVKRQELLTKWLAALRSGEYKQGTGALRTSSNAFCCLGVLCDVAGEKWERIGHMDFRGKNYRIDGNGGIPPTRVLDAIGFNLKARDDLMFLNDNKTVSFSHIAELIEYSLRYNVSIMTAYYEVLPRHSPND